MHSRHWCQNGILITVEGPEGRSSVAIDKPYARLADHDLAEVRLPGVGHLGLYLHATAAGVFFLPFSESNMPEEYLRGWLAPTQTIHLGEYSISAALDGPRETSDDAQKSQPLLDGKGTSRQPFPVVAICYRQNEVARRRLTRQLTLVGRTRPCTIPIANDDLSATHFAFFWDGGVLWAIDLLSRQGTFRGESRIECTDIPLGRSVGVGDVQLTFVGYDSVHDAKPNDNESGFELSFQATTTDASES
jgi:hypothetical protein